MKEALCVMRTCSRGVPPREGGFKLLLKEWLRFRKKTVKSVVASQEINIIVPAHGGS